MPAVNGPSGMAVTYTVYTDPVTGLPFTVTNTDTTVLGTLTAAAVGSNGADLTNLVYRGVKIVVDITTIAGTAPTLIVTIQGKDVVSGKYYTLLASAALAVTGTTVMTVYPGLIAAANLTANDVLPKTWRVITTIGGTTPAVTATVGASLVR